MNAFWDFYWPLLTAAVVVGVVTGWMGFRAKGARQPRTSEFRRHAALVVVAGAIAVLIFGALWHGPLGTGHRFATSIEQESRRVLVDWEMPQIQAQLEHRPLKRTLVLAGRRSGYIIILLGSILGSGVPVVHMLGKGLVGGRIANSSGIHFWVWTLLTLQVTAIFSLILSARGLWGFPWRRGVAKKR